jgi:hypothetical protein
VLADDECSAMRISSALILYEFIAFIDCELLIVGPFADGGTGGRKCSAF